jgi:hypothetical protein
VLDTVELAAIGVDEVTCLIDFGVKRRRLGGSRATERGADTAGNLS